MSDYGDVVHEVTPSGWHLGVIYANSKDARLVVPHRTGLGWTLNFGQPLAWLLLVGVLVVAGMFRRVRAAG
jgi:uncharacterized membrane protein